MQNIYTDTFRAIEGATDIRRVLIKGFEPTWEVEMENLLLRWRWSQYKRKLFMLLHAVARREYPFFYYDKPKPSRSMRKALRELKLNKHNGVLLAYNTKTKKLTISTEFIEKRDGRKKEDPRFLYVVEIIPNGIAHAFGVLVPEKRGDFVLNHEREKTPTNLTMYDCIECVNAKRKHQIIRIFQPGGKYTDSHYNQCTGCEAVSGPWQDGGY